MNQFSNDYQNLGNQNVQGSGMPNHQLNLPNSTAILILGIVSIVGCFCYGIVGFICGIIALVLAGKDKKLYNANPSGYTESSFKNMNAGRICAIIGLVLSSLYFIIIIGYIAIMGTAILSDPSIFLDKYK